MALGGPLEGRQKPAKKYNGAYANLSDRHRLAVKTFGRWRSHFYIRILQSGERAAAESARILRSGSSFPAARAPIKRFITSKLSSLR